jgi:peroxiredoxin
MKLRSVSLERMANIAVILAAAVCIVTWASFALRAPVSARDVSPRYVAGDSLAEVPEIATITVPRILVVFVNSLCRYCTESMPFYRQLSELRASNAGGDPASIIFVSREPLASLTTYLANHGIGGQLLIALPQGTPFKMTTTPTVLLLDRMRKVERVWVGLLSDSQRNEVLAIVSHPAVLGRH